MNIETGKLIICQTSHCYSLFPHPHFMDGWRYFLYSLLIAFFFILSGCSNIPEPVVKPAAPLYYIHPETWQSIDEQILKASLSARKKSEIYARNMMDNWLWKVRMRTESVFIPWYSSYWTQQWIASRVALYKIQYSEGEPTPEERLTQYLQNQYYKKVLEPVSDFIDPNTVMKDATDLYLRELKKRVEQLPYEYQIPVDEFNQHLKFIPAIIVQTKPRQEASLYDVLQTSNIDNLLAYKKLLAQIASINGSIKPGSPKDNLNQVAQRAVTKLVEQIELRGGASIASLIAGGHIGLLISVGAATWSISEHERDKPNMDKQLRKNLDVMLDLMWQNLVNDTSSGITAIVHHMNKKIEYSLFSLDSSGSKLF